jgi:hypothetical protein
MQLGKLDASQAPQGLSCKTGTNPLLRDQWLTSEKQNLQSLDLVVQDDDGTFALGWADDAASGFPSRLFAIDVAADQRARRGRAVAR